MGKYSQNISSNIILLISPICKGVHVHVDGGGLVRHQDSAYARGSAQRWRGAHSAWLARVVLRPNAAIVWTGVFRVRAEDMRPVHFFFCAMLIIKYIWFFENLTVFTHWTYILITKQNTSFRIYKRFPSQTRAINRLRCHCWHSLWALPPKTHPSRWCWQMHLPAPEQNRRNRRVQSYT